MPEEMTQEERLDTLVEAFKADGRRADSLRSCRDEQGVNKPERQ